MIYSTEKEVLDFIRQKKSPGISLIYGGDDYLVDYYSGLLAGKTKDDPNPYGLSVFYSGDLNFSDVRSSVETLSWFGDPRVLIKNYSFKKNKGADSDNFNDDDPELYINLIKSAGEDVNLIFSLCPGSTDIPAVPPNSYKIKNSKKWFDILNLFKERGNIFYIPKRSRAKLIEMLKKGALSRGSFLGDKEAELILNRTGEDMFLLRNEIEKLSNAGLGSAITEEKIEELTPLICRDDQFSIAENLNKKNPDRAYLVLKTLLEKKEKPELILGSVSLTYINIYRVKIAEKYDKKISDIANDIAGTNETALRIAKENSGSVTLKKVKDIIKAVSKADKLIKTTRSGEDITLFNLLGEINAIING